MMARWTWLVAFGVVAHGLVHPASAQRVGIAPHAGTLGTGLDVLVRANSRLAIRAAGNVLPLDVSFRFSGNRFEIDLPTVRWGLVGDLFLLGDFRLTAGVIGGHDMDMTARSEGFTTIGGTAYPAELVGDLTGRIGTHLVAPYFGFGVGLPGRAVGLFLDIGVALQGNPQVTALDASGPISSSASFQVDLENERQDIERDAEVFRYYPVVSIGLIVGVW